MNDKPPPSNLEAEKAVLGSVLIDPDAVVLVAPILGGDGAFANDKHAWTWKAALALSERGTPINYVTLCDELERRGRLDAVGTGYLMSLMNETPTSVHAEHYARIVDRMARKRKLADAAAKIARLAYDDGLDADAAEAQALAAVLTVQSPGERGKPMRDHLSEYYDRIEALNRGHGEPLGLTTGFDDLDAILRGIRGYVVLGGRPSMGKSSLALDIVMNLLDRGKRVAYFSLEDDAQSLANRVMAKATRLNAADLRDGRVRDWEKFLKTWAEYSDNGVGARLWVDDSPAPTVGEVYARTMRVKAQWGGLDLVVLDYVQLARSGDEYRDRKEITRVNDVSDGLKALGRLADVPVLAVSQLSRAVEERADKRPRLPDLRETGTLEQSADAVLFVYRDEYYNPDTTETPNIAEVIVAKNKNGPVGTCSLYFLAESTRFESAEISRRPIEVGGERL